MGLFDKLKADSPTSPVAVATPNLDRHLEALEEAPTNDLKPGELASMKAVASDVITPAPSSIASMLKQAAAKEEGNSSMSPIMIAQLVIMGMGLITDLIKAIRASKQGEEVDDAVFESAGGFLAKIGSQAGVKELNQDNISALLPAVKGLISKVHELRALNKD